MPCWVEQRPGWGEHRLNCGSQKLYVCFLFPLLLCCHCLIPMPCRKHVAMQSPHVYMSIYQILDFLEGSTDMMLEPPALYAVNGFCFCFAWSQFGLNRFCRFCWTLYRFFRECETSTTCMSLLLWMEEILYQLIDVVSHYLLSFNMFNHPFGGAGFRNQPQYVHIVPAFEAPPKVPSAFCDLFLGQEKGCPPGERLLRAHRSRKSKTKKRAGPSGKRLQNYGTSPFW